jgi:hypothetical protein
MSGEKRRAMGSGIGREKSVDMSRDLLTNTTLSGNVPILCRSSASRPTRN